jgi:hypothetical protein
MKVWILFLYATGSFYHGGAAVIENIASEKDCLQLAKTIEKNSEKRGVGILPVCAETTKAK